MISKILEAGSSFRFCLGKLIQRLARGHSRRSWKCRRFGSRRRSKFEKKLFKNPESFPSPVSMASRKETFRYPKSFFGRPRPCSSKETFGSHFPTMSHRATLACPLLWTGAKHRSCLQVLRPQLCRRFFAKGTKVIL